MLGALALALASQARAESDIIPPDQAEAFVRAQMEEQKAAAEALRDDEAPAGTSKSGKAAKAADKKKTRQAPAPALAQGKEDAEESAAEETASLPLELPIRSRSERADVAKASALKPLIVQYASENGVPYELADAVVRLESRYNSGARRGLNVGLTQINVRTAQSLGYKGDAAGLLDAETNLRYGLKYLAIAYRLAGRDTCGAILRYQFGLRTTSMNDASRTYCAKVQVLTAAAD